MARVFAAADTMSSSTPSMAVAYSGGLDSSVLLHLATGFAKTHGIRLFAFHVHHGLSDQADAWLAHCADRAMQSGATFDMRRIEVNGTGDGIEAAARSGRYAALGEMCRAHGVPLLLTAHHQDDQAETVLLQLLRGSGVAGLSGMDQCNLAPELLGDATLFMARPLLSASRSMLAAFTAAESIPHVDDPSNQDPRYARNALRTHVMPVLEQRFPGFASRFARSAAHAQAAQQLLIELAAEDLQACAEGDTILIDRLRTLSQARSDNLLRYWFGRRGMRMPSTAWLEEMRSQLFSARNDARILVGHADCDIHRHRNRIVMTPRYPLPDPERDPEQDRIGFTWTGQPQIQFAALGGTLHFDAAALGFDAAWLAAQALSLQPRSGGWRLRLAANRPSRSLKYHYQAADVPAWERNRLPLVTVGRSLLYAAGLGMDCTHFSQEDGSRIALRWEFDPA